MTLSSTVILVLLARRLGHLVANEDVLEEVKDEFIADHNIARHCIKTRHIQAHGIKSHGCISNKLQSHGGSPLSALNRQCIFPFSA